MAMLRPTSEMKDSGVREIGRIPKEWSSVRIARIIENSAEGIMVGPFGSSLTGAVVGEKDGKYKVYGQANLIRRDFDYGDKFIDEKKYKELARYKVIPGDIAISMMGTVGKCRVIPEGIRDGIMDSHLIKARLSTHMIPKYYEYIYESTAVFDQIMAKSTGTIMTGINSNIVKSLYVVLPPLSQQQAIADYLDDRCSKIDEIIADVTTSIEEYKELKHAVIFEAVTKGLDKNVPMRNTGNLWLPELPVDVPLSRVSRHYTVILGKMLCPNKRDNDDSLEPYYCAANVHFDGISGALKEMWFNTSEKESYSVHKADMLIVEGGAGAGGAAIVEEEPEQPTFVQNSVMIVRSKDSEDNRYLCYLVQALVKSKYVDFVCNKATIPHFTKEKVSGIPYPVWNKEKRKEIADYLDERTSQMDSLISEKQALIDDLQTYKKSLIYEVVTGKRRVV